MSDRTSIESIINVLQTNLGQLINPDIDAITFEDLELIATMCDQIVESLKSSLLFLKRFNYHFSGDEEKKFSDILIGINDKLNEDRFVSDNESIIFPLYLMVSKLAEDQVSDLELYFIVFSLAYHVHHEIDRRILHQDDPLPEKPSRDEIWYDEDTDSFVMPSPASGNDDGNELVLHLRNPSIQKKTFDFLSIFEKT